jgi:hypothetical protein
LSHRGAAICITGSERHFFGGSSRTSSLPSTLRAALNR